MKGFGASARPRGVRPLGYLDVQRSRDAGESRWKGKTGSRMCVCRDVAPARHGWSLIQSRRTFVVMVSGIAGLRRHCE